MRVLRRFPRLEPALRDGRLCASTVALLGPLLTDENLDDLITRAAYRTKAEVEELVVSLRPRPEPQEGIRRLPGPTPPVAAPSARSEQSSDGGGLLALGPQTTVAAPAAAGLVAVASAAPVAPRVSSARVEPVSEDRWSVRVTLDAEMKAELETLKALLSHKVPTGDLREVLREAIRCGVEKHGKRKGAVVATRKPRPVVRAGEGEPNASSDPGSTHITAAVRREVWKRDGGRCTFVSPDGSRCNSRWRLELDHIEPVALGGTSTVPNLRLRCRGHNMLHAERTYGREHMDQFRKASRTIASDSSSIQTVVESG
jgi:hypothetical protein